MQFLLTCTIHTHLTILAVYSYISFKPADLCNNLTRTLWWGGGTSAGRVA